jgi:transglutaminase-like putative cysteine protease
MEAFLQHSQIIDWRHKDIEALAADLGAMRSGEESYAERAFLWVRDQIDHSWDVRRGPVTCIASDVLRFRTGFCFAKSHLLAALLRAGGIPAGFCYQRLRIGEGRFSLHGLNAVFLQKHGWYRIDPRGDKAGIHTCFCPPVESLAFRPDAEGERDLPDILAEPLAIVVEALQGFAAIEDLDAHLPDLP